MEAPIKNRRLAPRAKVSLPVLVRCFGSSWPDEIAKTSNVSREGLYFETKSRHYLEQYFHNWKVRVVRNFRAGDIANLEETGQIVRIDHLAEGALGVAIHILLREKQEFAETPNPSNPKK
jgi:hypothetical protein